ASSATGTTSAVGTPAVWCPEPSGPAASAGAASTRKPTAVTRPARRRYLGLTAFPLVALYQRRRNDRRFLGSALPGPRATLNRGTRQSAGPCNACRRWETQAA